MGCKSCNNTIDFKISKSKTKSVLLSTKLGRYFYGIIVSLFFFTPLLNIISMYMLWKSILEGNANIDKLKKNEIDKDKDESK